MSVHRFVRPIEQSRHVPHGRLGFTATRYRGETPVWAAKAAREGKGPTPAVSAIRLAVVSEPQPNHCRRMASRTASAAQGFWQRDWTLDA